MKKFRKNLRWFVLLTVALLLAIFAIQNAAIVEWKFLNLTVETRRAYVV